MDQKPIFGQDALVPPEAGTARQYLAEERAVSERRDRAVDRRALGWLQIVNAVVTSTFLAVCALLLQRDVTNGYQVVLFTFIVWGQLAGGMAQRAGVQWRLSRRSWPLVTAGAAMVVAVLVVFGLSIFVPGLPVAIVLAPSVLVLLLLGGYGVVQLVRSSGEEARARITRMPLPRGARLGTVGVGVVVGALIALASAPEGVLTSVLTLMVALLVIAWFFAGATDMALAAVGARWRWPHATGFAVAAVALVVIVLLGSDRASGGLAVGLVAGAGVVVLFVVLSLVPGRDLGD